MAFADETRAENDVGAIFEDRLDELGIFGRVVFQIGVLHDNNGAGGALEAGAEGSAFALVLGLINDRMSFRLEFRENVARAVGAAVVNENDLLGNRRSFHATNQLAHPLFFVIDRDDNRQL